MKKLELYFTLLEKVFAGIQFSCTIFEFVLSFMFLLI